MFILIFKPAATGWLRTADDNETDEPMRRPLSLSDHTVARAYVAATLPAPGKQIGSVVWDRDGNW
jgi:hypothetical protein